MKAALAGETLPAGGGVLLAGGGMLAAGGGRTAAAASTISGMISGMISPTRTSGGADRSNNGGLGGLVDKFRQAGLGDVIGSWVGSGANRPVSGDQLTQVLGGDTMAELARQMGLNPDDAANQLSHILPGVVDTLTPQGHVPSEGLGNSGDLMGMLDGLQGK